MPVCFLEHAHKIEAHSSLIDMYSIYILDEAYDVLDCFNILPYAA